MPPIPKIHTVTVEDHVKEAYVKYGTYVVEERAVADFRDGLKPVQRRIMYAMHDMGLTPTSRFMKCSGTVGEVLKFYHPHGDQSVYSTMVGMVWDRYPTVDGKGNFGSDLDPPAAYRYTEARRAPVSQALFDCLDVASFTDNFDGTKKEPLVLPSRLPFILLNGNSGIAVGITSEIPPHNIQEIQNACLAVLKAGDRATLATVLEHVQGPDYGSAVLTSPSSDVESLYKTGEGALTFRCTYKIEDDTDHKRLVVNGYAPRFSAKRFIDSCQKMVEAGNLLDIVNESSADNGKRLVVSFTNGAFLAEHVLPLLETSITYRFYVTERISESNIKVKLLGLLPLIQEWIAYRRRVETDLLNNEIKDIQSKLDRENARLIGIQNIKTFAKLLADTTEKTPLRDRVMAAFKITKEMADVILDFPIRTLASSNESDQLRKIVSLEKEIAGRNKLLQNIDKVLESKFSKMSEYYPVSDVRGMAVRSRIPKLDTEDTAEMWIGVSNSGDIQRMEEVPVRKGAFKWDYFLRTGSHVWVVDGTGKMIRRTMSVLSKGQTSDSKCRNIPGVFSSFARKVVLLEKDGMASVFDPTTLTRDEYQGIKTDHGVVAVAEMVRGDILLAWNKEAVVTYDYDELQVTRTNVNGWRLLPRRTATGMMVLPSDGVLVGDGKKIKPENIPMCKKVFCVGKQNLLILEDGTRFNLDKEQAFKQIISSQSVVSNFNGI